MSFTSASFGDSEDKIYAYGSKTDLDNGDPSKQFMSFGLFELNLETNDWTKALDGNGTIGRLNGAELIYDEAQNKLYVVGGFNLSATGNPMPTSSIWSIDLDGFGLEQVYGQTPTLGTLPWGMVSAWHNEVSRTIVIAVARADGDYALSVYNLDTGSFEDIKNSTSFPPTSAIPSRLSILDTGHQALLLYPETDGTPLGRYLHADYESITDTGHPLTSVDSYRNNGAYFFSKDLQSGIYVGGAYASDGRLPTRALKIGLDCLF